MAHYSMRIPFGKYAGARIEDVPSSYLVWFLNNTNHDYSLQRAIELELDARTRSSQRQKQEPPSPKPLRIPAAVSLEVALSLVEAGRRNMAKTLHPDTGGSTEAMQRVNASADWLSEHLAEVLP